MQLKISDRLYDLTGVAKLSLSDLILIKKATGITLRDLETRLNDGIDDPEAFSVIIWMARVHAGEKSKSDPSRPIGFHEAIDFPFSEVEIVLSEDEKAEQAAEEARLADPTSPPVAEVAEPAVLADSLTG